jgi:sialate O-acetylesterase
MRWRACSVLLLATVAWMLSAMPGAAAELKLPAIISDHMVLQAEKPAAIWGWAAPGDQVTATIAGRSQTTQTGADGKWQVTFGKLPASAQPQTLTVQGRTTLTVNDVLVGEVWLASGQSNMAMQIKGKLHGAVERADEEIAAAKYPAIRMFLHDTPFAIYELPTPPGEALADRPGTWQVCSPETVADFSAIGYFFARDLHRELRVPVGIVCAAVGGTPIEAWTSLTAQQAEPTLGPLLADWTKRLTNFDPPTEQQAFLDAKQKWQKQRSAALKQKQPAPKAPAPFKNLRVMTPGGLFNGAIAPLAPYSMRGCIWYQGERNAAGPFTGLYGIQLKTLIADWRTRWGDEFYFAWVQLPRFQKEQRLPSEPKGWGVAVRDEMRKALTLPHTGMAITIDLGGENDGHPMNKTDFAARLSPVVLREVYDRPIEFWTGPLFRTAQRDGGKIVLKFEHATGLKAATGELQGFAVAGADQKFVWGKALIDGETVTVWSDEVPEPVAVRYGWAANPKCNLVNGGGLPASPFRTDDWK